MKSEHFVTLFDSNFLPIGLSLYQSLANQSASFLLWIICADKLVETQLRELALPNVRLIPLRDMENASLLSVKKTRSAVEYLWTLTPYTITAVFERDASVSRVTYLDADLFFFGPPSTILSELDYSAKHVLITEHAYDPRYDQSANCGKYCVQFMTFRRSEEALRVVHWWQDRCIEWCHARFEDGKFGDQKYLDEWPKLFPESVHVLENKSLALAPWNVDRFMGKEKRGFLPVFYHFHSLRIVSPKSAKLYSTYRLSRHAKDLYRAYLCVVRKQVNLMGKHEIPLKIIAKRTAPFTLYTKNRILGREVYRSF